MAQPVRQLQYDAEARKLLQEGVNKLAKAVVTTLGPRGKNVAFETPWGEVKVLHDGVSVAKEVFLEDKFENMGAQLVKQAAEKTNDQAGDGTTTATLIAQSIVNQGNKAITDGVNPMFMKRGIDKAIKAVTEELKTLSTPVTEEEWEQVATISAQNEKIGKIISDALKMVGQDGLVEVAEGSKSDIEIEHTEGMEFQEGYVSQYFFTNPNTLDCEFDKPFILITDARLSSSQPLLNVLKKVNVSGRPLLIFADNVDGECLQTLILNKIKGVVPLCVVRAPLIGEDRERMLEDLAILTGGQVVSANTGIKLEEVELEQCGIAEKVIVTKDSCRIVNGSGSEDAIKDRIQQLKTQAEETENEFLKTKINERIAKLTRGVALIRVGAATEVELNDLKERVKDAIGATRAAIEEGIIAGGGVSILSAMKVIDTLKADSEDEKRGLEIVKEALYEPTKQLAINSGIDGDNVVTAIINTNKKNYGYNVATQNYGDLIEEGVIDPVKVVRLALENGASVASMILTTACLIADKPLPTPPATS